MAKLKLKADKIVLRLLQEGRVLLLGGMAVVLQGFSRTTQDIDVWFEPMESPLMWSKTIANVLKSEKLSVARVVDATGAFNAIALESIADVVAQDRFVRILGANRPIDVFRAPRNLRIDEFDQAWERGEHLKDGLRMLDAIDLILTKMETGRPHDEADIRFLERKVESNYRSAIRTCSIDEARALLDRFATPDIVAFAARDAQNSDVRLFGEHLLSDMVKEGDPYARELMSEIERGRTGDERGR